MMKTWSVTTYRERGRLRGERWVVLAETEDEAKALTLTMAMSKSIISRAQEVTSPTLVASWGGNGRGH